MPARETEALESKFDQAAEVAPPEAEAAKSDFQTEGDLPAVAKDSAAVGPTASELAFGAQGEVDVMNLDRGMHSPEQFHDECNRLGKVDKWHDYYRNGHTGAKGWVQPYERRTSMDFELQKGASASASLQAFLKGPTICDYRCALLADELDELRDEMGDRKFDELFGSAHSNTDAAIPKGQRLRITAGLYSTPIIDQMKAIAAEHDRALAKKDEPAAPVVESRVEEKPKQAEALDQEPVVVAQELGMQQQDRELV